MTDRHQPDSSGGADSRSPLLALIVQAWQTMTSTVYSHRTFVDHTHGVYEFDCVEMTSHFLHLATPRANAEMRNWLGTRRGFVPRPIKTAQFFSSLPVGEPTAWQRVATIDHLRGGDMIVIPPAIEGNPGHAVVAAGTPELLPSGGYRLPIYDSTAGGHGPTDTRHSDPRNRIFNGKPSGLGRGLIELGVGEDGTLGRMRWSVGGKVTGLDVLAARPLG